MSTKENYYIGDTKITTAPIDLKQRLYMAVEKYGMPKEIYIDRPNCDNPSDEMIIIAAHKEIDARGENHTHISALIRHRIMYILKNDDFKSYKKRKLINQLENLCDTKLYRAAYLETKENMYGVIRFLT